MRTTLFAAPRRAVLLLIVVAVLLLLAPAAFAKIRTVDGGYVPFYARIERGEVLHTGEWVPIIFYYPPECVPAGFDLLDFYDFGAPSCDKGPTTDGFTIWSGEPFVTPPIQTQKHGLGTVPVWFVDWPTLRNWISVHDSLTMSELEAMSPMKGLASSYTETLHPTGGAQVPMINYVASGTLDGGQSFYVHALLVLDKALASDVITNVSIKFE